MQERFYGFILHRTSRKGLDALFFERMNITKACLTLLKRPAFLRRTKRMAARTKPRTARIIFMYLLTRKVTGNSTMIGSRYMVTLKESSLKGYGNSFANRIAPLKFHDMPVVSSTKPIPAKGERTVRFGSI